MAIALLSIPTRTAATSTGYVTDTNLLTAKINELATAMAVSPLTISAAVGAGNPAADMNAVVAKVNELIGIANSTAPVTTPAATPTGSFNPSSRVYTISIGSYPLSRLLVSTQYGAFAAAATLSYQIPDSYRAPEYYRFKLAAAGTETESAVLASPMFPAKGSLVDIPVGIIGYIQSNGTGFAHVADIAASDRGPYPLALIYNDANNAIEQYQLGVNDQGSTLIALPTYDRGFGADYEYAKRVQASGVRECLIKKAVAGTDGAGFNKWDAGLYDTFKGEIQRAFAALNAAGYNPVVKWIQLDVKEAEDNNADFAAQYHARINRFETDGLINAQTQRMIMMGYRTNGNNDAVLRAKQEQLYQLDTTRYRKIDIGFPATLDGTHLASPGQILAGDTIFNVNHNTTTPPPTGGGGSGGVGTFMLKSGYDGNQKITAIGSGSVTTVANGFTAFAKVVPRALGTVFSDPQYVISIGDLGGDESPSLYFTSDYAARLRVKLASGYVNPEPTLSGLTTAQDAAYRAIMVGYEQGGTAYLNVYINGTVYPFTFTGSFNRNTAPVVFGGILVNGSATAFAQNILGELSQMGYINRAYSASEVAALDAAGLVLTEAQYTAAEVAIYAPGPTETASSLSTANLADTAHPLTLDRHA